MANAVHGPWLIAGINERLIELHARDGSAVMSMSMLAATLNKEFGLKLTRNAIVGRCHRLKLPAREAPIIRKPKPGPKSMKIVKIDAPIVPHEAIKPPEDNVLTIYQLGFGDCRWPLGEAMDRPPFLYCGQAALEGRPYCAAHCRQAYNTPRVSWV
jgi:hypothetical protein